MLPAVNFNIVNHLNPRLVETETPISGIALCSVYKRSIHLCVCVLQKYSQKLPDLPVCVTLMCLVLAFIVAVLQESSLLVGYTFDNHCPDTTVGFLSFQLCRVFMWSIFFFLAH